jgi:hypothetical protein
VEEISEIARRRVRRCDGKQHLGSSDMAPYQG